MNLSDVLSMFGIHFGVLSNMLNLVRCHWLSFNVRFDDALLLRIIDVMFMVCEYTMYDVLNEVL